MKTLWEKEKMLVILMTLKQKAFENIVGKAENNDKPSRTEIIT